MKHTRGLVSVAQALCRTFIAPINAPRAGLIHPHLLQPIRHQLQIRSFKHSYRLVDDAADKAPINEAIDAPYVQLVNEQNDLEPPVRLSKVLASFDPREFYLVQVAPAANGRPPVCKILNKMEVREKEKARAKASKAGKAQTKQMELNWAIDVHDLEHRLKQLVNFLEKGRKVELVLSKPKKRGKRAATVEEIKNVMQRVMDTSKQCGASLVKPIEGEPGKHVVITLKKEKHEGTPGTPGET